jgi:glycosyltransferase involved in cell wall biosynthesis
VKRAALLAYYFPPLGGAGVQRAVQLARRLPDHGWDVVVVTGPGSADDRWTPHDATLAAGVDVEVVRVEGPEPPRTDTRAERWARRESAWARWWRDGAARAVAALDVDLVVATLSPYEGAAPAAAAAAQLGVPWVADLRDPWALDEMIEFPSRLHRSLELRAMRRRLASAAAIVMNTADARAALVGAFPELAPRATEPVPNGFDADELAVAAETRADDAFRIVHAGYLHTELSARGLTGAARRLLGGSLDRVDVGARSHLYLLEAIDRLRIDEPGLGRRIELHLVGVRSRADEAAGNRPYVRWRGYLPHAETVAALRSADALFLPMHDLPAARRARIVPGKTYEYLGVGRPIVAAVPDGDARDLLRRAGNAALCRPRDAVGIADALRRVAAGEVAAEASPAVLATIERPALVARFARILDGVAGAQRAAVAA